MQDSCTSAMHISLPLLPALTCDSFSQTSTVTQQAWLQPVPCQCMVLLEMPIYLVLSRVHILQLHNPLGHLDGPRPAKGLVCLAKARSRWHAM